MKPQVENLINAVIALSFALAAGQSESAFHSLVVFFLIAIYYKLGKLK